nr:hypothetical protein [Tanacetum cinerariifolium]
MPGYRSSSEEELDQAGDDLANTSYPFLAKVTADPYVSIEQLLSKKLQSLRSKPALSLPNIHLRRFQLCEDRHKLLIKQELYIALEIKIGFGSIASGLDHVNSVIRLPLEYGIGRVLGKVDHLNPSVRTNQVTASIT